MIKISAVCIILISVIAEAQGSRGFDTNESARFSKVTSSVGFIQDAETLVDAPVLQKRAKKFTLKSKRSMASRRIASVEPPMTKKYFKRVLAVGLSSTEMKNLGVKPGDVVEITHGAKITKAYVYTAGGPYRPPEATVNLSLAAAQKLGLQSGDVLEIRHSK